MIAEELRHYYEDRPILITGGAGFIGSHLAERAVALGARVTILDNFSTGSYEHLCDIASAVTIIEGDIVDAQQCHQAARGQKTIFHCAAMASVPLSCSEPYRCTQINVIGTANMLDAAAQHNVENFVFSSSAAVYGAREDICTETDPCNPISPYGWSKYIGEHLCRHYGETTSLRTICLRYFNVFGPRQKTGVVAQFRHKMATGTPIIVQGDGTQERDFVSVYAVIEANLLVAARSGSCQAGEAFNVASGRSISLLNLIAELQQEYQDYQESLITFAPTRSGDVQRSQGSRQKYLMLTK